MSEETVKPFRKVSEKEYQILLDNKWKDIHCPFALTEKIFHAFISNGGVIDPTTGQVQTDIISLVTSFKEVGNLLLSEYDLEGKLVKEGNCTSLCTSEVVSLFLLASHIVESFMLELGNLQKAQTQMIEK